MSLSSLDDVRYKQVLAIGHLELQADQATSIVVKSGPECGDPRRVGLSQRLHLCRPASGGRGPPA